MSSKKEKVSALLADCRRYNLAGLDFLLAHTIDELVVAYNGLGPAWFHPLLRKAIDHLAPDLRPIALIHDARFTYGDGTREWFDRANDELEANGLSIADQKYRWYNPMRYITRFRARTYAAVCRLVGWSAFIGKARGTKQVTFDSAANIEAGRRVPEGLVDCGTPPRKMKGKNTMSIWNSISTWWSEHKLLGIMEHSMTDKYLDKSVKRRAVVVYLPESKAYGKCYGPQKDGDRMNLIMKKLGIPTVSLTGGDATKARLLETLDGICSESVPGELLFFYFSGFGGRDPVYPKSFPQTECILMDDTFVTSKELAEVLNRHKGRVFMMTDLDHNGYRMAPHSSHPANEIHSSNDGHGGAVFPTDVFEPYDPMAHVFDHAHDQLFRVLRVTMYDAGVKVPMLVWSSEYKYRWDRNTYAWGSMFTSGFVGGVNFKKTYKGVYDEICSRLDYEDTILDTHPLFEGKPVTKPYMEALNGFDATKVVFN